MSLSEMMGYGGLPQEQQKGIEMMTLAGMLAQALKGSAPSTDPSHRPGIHNAGNILEGGLAGMQGGLAQMMQAEKLKALNAETQNTAAAREALKSAGMAGMPPEQVYSNAISSLIKNGNYEAAAKLAPILKTLKGDKEFNIPGDVDTFLAAHYPYDTEAKRFAALNEFNKPEVRQKFIEWKQKTALPYFQTIPTSQGYVTVNARTGKPGESTGLEKPLSPEMITTQQQIGTLKETLNRTKNLYNPDYVGMVQGRTGTVKENTIGVPDEQAAFYSNLEQIKNTLVYLMSGKQINEQEYNRLLAQLPTRNLPDNVFKTRMEEFDKTLNSIIEERQKASGGYGVPKSGTQPAKKKLVFNPATGRFE